MLKAKLCRRLAKLEMDKSRVPSVSAIYIQFFDSIGPILKGIIEKAIGQVESAWANFKTTIARLIPALPPRADKQALHLSLTNSDNHLKDLLALRPAQ